MSFRHGNRLFVLVGCTTMLVAALGATNAYTQEAVEAEKMAKKVAEAQIREQQKVIEAMRAELKAQQDALAAQQKDFREQQKLLESKQQEARRIQESAENARALVEKMRSEGAQAASESAKLLQQFDGQNKDRFSRFDEWKQRMKATPLPENAQTRIFTLRHSKLPEVGRVLADIVGERGLRLGADERTNSLIVSTDEKTMSDVEALLQKLDASPAKAALDLPMETLQLRTIWLLDNADGRDASSAVGPQVLDALKQLGFEKPSVVSQQVSTLTLGEDKREGDFQFAVPVLIEGAPWQLSGSGIASPTADGRFALRFELEVTQTNNPQNSRIGGSIYSPLGHYTVMGTTTFVQAGQQSGQHLSAFVVYLDRAQEFSTVLDRAPEFSTVQPERKAEE